MSTMSTTSNKRKLVLGDILDHRAYERVREAMRATAKVMTTTSHWL